MPRPAGLLLESLNDLRLALDGLPGEDALVRHNGASSIAWTAGHVTQMLESWLLHRFMNLPRDEMLRDAKLGAGGSGMVEDWPALRAKIAYTHEIVTPWLAGLSTPDMERTVPYDGSIAILRPTGLNLEYALLRIAAHHFSHAGEIATIRASMGHHIPDNHEWGRLFL